jgi:hypothetical protein
MWNVRATDSPVLHHHHPVLHSLAVCSVTHTHTHTHTYHRFVQKTYKHEGDNVLCFDVADDIAELTLHVGLVRGGAMPNTRAVARAVIDAHPQHGALLQPAKDVKVEELVQEQLTKIEASFVYFDTRMLKLKVPLDIFKACRAFDPSRIAHLAGNGIELERQLHLFPFLDAPAVAVLMADLPVYLARAAATPIQRNQDQEFEYEAWWAAYVGDAAMQGWYKAAIQVLILQPSSAAAERVFSMLKALMGDQQMARALEDYQEAALMSRYNQLQRYKVG